MGLYIENDNDLFGGNGFLAARRNDHIEVWCEDGERFYGNVPLDFTLTNIEVAVNFFSSGEGSGIETGKRLKTQEFRALLGIL